MTCLIFRNQQAIFNEVFIKDLLRMTVFPLKAFFVMNNEHVVSIFFDLFKAYGTTLKNGILEELCYVFKMPISHIDFRII